MDRVRKFEIWASILIIAVCAVVIYETLDLPPGSFEPLGSAPVPQATAGIIIILSIVVIVNAFRPRRADISEDTDDVPDEPVSAFLLCAATLLYVLTLHFRLLGFGTLTAIYLFALISALERFQLKSTIIAAVIAVIGGYGIQYLFTQVFVVDLPAS